MLRSTLVAGLLVSLPCHASQLESSDARQQATRHSTVDRNPNLAVSMEGLLRFLGEFHDDRLADSLLLGLVHMYGLGFRLSPADKERLKTAGASDSLVESLEAAPVHIIAPPRPPTGFLSVICQPLDCEVQVDGRRIGVTSQGTLAGISLPVGEATVRATRENYEVDPNDKTVSVGSGGTTNLLFHLTPSRRVIEAEGASRFSRVLAALGAEILLSGPGAQMRATGVLEVRSRDANRSTWSAVTSISSTGFSRFQLARGGRKYDLTLRNGVVSWKKRPKRREAGELEEAIRFLMDYELTSLMKRVNGPPFRILAGMTRSSELDPGSLRARADNESFTISIDSSSRPTEVLLESAGLDAGTRVLYSRYADLGGFVYPQETEVLRSGGTDGVAIRFDRIERRPLVKSKTSENLVRPLRGQFPFHAGLSDQAASSTASEVRP